MLVREKKIDLWTKPSAPCFTADLSEKHKNIYLKHLVSVKADVMHLSTQLCLINTHQNKMSWLLLLYLQSRKENRNSQIMILQNDWKQEIVSTKRSGQINSNLLRSKALNTRKKPLNNNVKCFCCKDLIRNGLTWVIKMFFNKWSASDDQCFSFQPSFYKSKVHSAQVNKVTAMCFTQVVFFYWCLSHVDLESWEMRGCSQSRGGLWETVTPVHNINFRWNETEIERGDGGGGGGGSWWPTHVFVCPYVLWIKLVCLILSHFQNQGEKKSLWVTCEMWTIVGWIVFRLCWQSDAMKSYKNSRLSHSVSHQV